MSNCTIIMLEGELALTHLPPHRQTHIHTLTHLPPRMHTPMHPQYFAAGSTSVIHKMTILQRRSPFMDDLVRSNPLPSTSRLAEGPR
ncbi:hypothetical protein O181_081899 [Austropuccinia psidii MF-1]|uniref:Uncharacterized protein n=1 Tax=Austropuccinia psidii MF-1 TaxID=1389203 RepID=A0A9Q3IKJ0_9BASI|nr:hypothetical protein [Austropuccinia psidii MF-1]